MEVWMKWLCSDTVAGDRLFFHFSGHGGQSRDRTGDELDGMNETLCPLDYARSGQIVDSWINQMMVNPLPQGVVLHCLVDACHSGTVLDLPFLSKGKNHAGKWVWEDQRRRVYKGTSGGECICFSGCDDSQTSADTASLSGTGVSTGAVTFSFIKAIEEAIASRRPAT
jgi:hypothetical protein